MDEVGAQSAHAKPPAIKQVSTTLIAEPYCPKYVAMLGESEFSNVCIKWCKCFKYS